MQWAERLSGWRARAEGLGAAVTQHIWRLGFASRFFAYTVVHSGTALRRFRLTVREIYFAGVLSLIIILVSGLFVGMVLALQGYDTLQRFGASESLGVLVALSLVREFGPVVGGRLCASRAGSAITAEIGLMKATEQLSAMEMMAVDPIARVVAPRFWGGVISMPLLAALFSAMGIFGGDLLAALLFLALKVGNLASFSTGQIYQVYAKFANIGGLKARAPVKSAGVVVGRVADIRFDNESYEAIVTINLGYEYQFPRDTTAKILTSGILGEQYVGLEAGGDGVMLKNGDRLRLTQSAVVLENLISQFLFNKAAEGKPEAKDAAK